MNNVYAVAAGNTKGAFLGTVNFTVEPATTGTTTSTGTPNFYVSGKAVNQMTCGSTYTFQVDGYTGSQVWLEQTKNGNQNYSGLLIVPYTYTTVCNSQEGTYADNVYTVSSSGGKGTLLGSVTVKVNPAQATITITTTSPLPAAVVGQAYPTVIYYTYNGQNNVNISVSGLPSGMQTPAVISNSGSTGGSMIDFRGAPTTSWNLYSNS